MGLGDLKEVEDYFGIKREPPPQCAHMRPPPQRESDATRRGRELHEAFERGMVVGAAIIEWAEAIRARKPAVRWRWTASDANGESWSATEGSTRLVVWLSLSITWHWEVWHLDQRTDQPHYKGKARTLTRAQRAAEDWAATCPVEGPVQ